ncbi:hypothetical protein C9374_014047 [Naegleria lovaniensis]|uniref:Cation-transporting P-type ATPase N-terminal domain-containing protein n=1 Tax=Naegleria lovaniensis TaxID=51637 RepID=A0AA88KUY1_NAELO|nr:uncharacterized protein C9374_014047 [Naegleria lovaniensis]KAG2389487.1 hypothetical protein C9374_014047 [Naegleria lovaniensis]
MAHPSASNEIELEIHDDHHDMTPMISNQAQPSAPSSNEGGTTEDKNKVINSNTPSNTTPQPNTSNTASAPRASSDLARRVSQEKTKRSMDIPRYFEEARQSIDIVQSAERELKDPNILKQKSKKERQFLQKAKAKAIDITEHEMTVDKVCENYSTSFDSEKPDKSRGLTAEVAAERLRVNGPNALAPPKKRPFIFKVIEQFTSLFSLLLILAGLLSFLDVAIERTTESYPNLFLGAILWLVVIFNAVVTLWQEQSSEKILESFQEMQSESSWVIRDGVAQKIECTQLVLGDIVKIEAGDKIPADMRLLHVTQLKVDNSSLTGEADPQARTVEMTSKNPLETNNLAFYGTMALEGSAYGVIVRCGNQSVIGQIAMLAGSTVTLKTPLRREIDGFVRKIGIIAFGMALLFFCLGFIIGNSWFQNFIFAIGIITANIPQGLIATVTACLTVSASRLKAVNVLVKKLEHVETLGSTSVICSDKTGTLTQNRMTAVEIWCDGTIRSVDYKDRYMMKKDPGMTTYAKEGEENLSTEDKLRRCAALCSTAYILPDEDNMVKPILDRECKGDASESALIKYIETRTECGTIAEFRNDHPEIYSIPFNSKNKYMLMVVKNNLTPTWSNNQDHSRPGKALLMMKGAPERIIQRCTHIEIGGRVLPLDETWKQYFQDAYNFFASKGERVLGFAQLFVDEHIVLEQKTREGSGKTNADTSQGQQNSLVPMEGLIFLGMAGLTDPPKIGVPEAVHKCKTAGIQVVMVTGDHPATAKAIAKQVGIIEQEAKTIEDIAEEEGVSPKSVPYSRADAVVLHGEEIDKLTAKEWSQILKKKQIVFSRTSPQQKLLIVSKFQELGHCVAVTGDGTNDSPALKKADIGVAMNISGSAVSKEAAALILLDDNFASIVNGVQEGRLIFDNLKKSIAYTLTHLFPEVGPFLAYVVFGIPLPMTGLLVLCIDLGTELVAAVSLAYENAESDIMRVPPRSRNDSLVGFTLLAYSYLQMGMIETMACFMNYFFAMSTYGVPPRYLWWGSKNGYFNTDTKKDLYIEETGVYISPSDQLNILSTAQTAYFLSIVICQWITLFSTKTRRLSVFTHGFFGNLVVYLGIVFSVALLAIFIYCPFIGDYIFQTRYMIIDFWVYPLPWMAAMLFYDEMRKWIIRRLNLRFLFW